MVLNENARRGIRKKNHRPIFGESREVKNGSVAERRKEKQEGKMYGKKRMDG